MPESPRILITGTNSFIGTNFCKLTKYENHTEISLRKIEISEIDFSKFDVILHLAAIVHQTNAVDTEKYFRVNRDLTSNLAIRAKLAGVRHFIFLSTVKVYGKVKVKSEIWNEESICLPDDAYGKSKYEAEIELKKLESDNFTVSIIRTPIVYGLGVGANFMKLIKLIDAFPVLPFKSVNNNRHYTYVGNLIGYIDRIIEIKASGTFIVMDAEPLATTDLVKKITSLLNRRTVLFRLPQFIIKTWIKLYPGIFDRLYGSFFLDNIQTRTKLQYNPPYSTDEGLGILIGSYLSSKD
jgi:nucleoside-diphosphate-sugar epimerase